jgi:hypothetical protein
LLLIGKSRDMISAVFTVGIYPLTGKAPQLHRPSCEQNAARNNKR